jgi:hypothetical protein
MEVSEDWSQSARSRTLYEITSTLPSEPLGIHAIYGHYMDHINDQACARV